MPVWFNNIEFWKSLYPIMFSPQKFARAFEEVNKIIELISFKGDRILDLCCGPGRHTIEFAKRGYKVTGVDKIHFLLKKAIQYAENENVNIEFIQEDMRNFKCNEYFDLIINMFTSFGYFESLNDDKKVLRNIYLSMKNKGIFFLESAGKELLAKIFLKTISNKFEDGSILIQRHKVIDDWTRIQNEWILLRNDKVKRFKFKLRIYSAQEIKTLLINSGFKEIKIYGDLLGNEYDDKAKRLIVVAKK